MGNALVTEHHPLQRKNKHTGTNPKISKNSES